MANVSCTLHHWGVQRILSYSWVRPAILVADEGGGGGGAGVFISSVFFTFILVPLSSLSLFFISSNISSIFFLPYSERLQK